MNLAFNPKDSNTFASSCLDRTVKIWTLGSSQANFTLDAHDKGVNYVEYYHGGEKPYLLTCGDDRTIKVWDYISKSCVQTLSGHQSNVSFAVFHPSLPLIISGSEDGTVKLWHSNTYRLESTLDYGLERAWCVAYRRKGNDVGLGFDHGAVVVKLGKEEPSVSMDTSGKVVWAKGGSEIITANVGAVEYEHLTDAARVPIQTREMGTTEVYPQTLQHSPNGRFVSVCGDGEFIIYTALAWRNKAFGPGLSFAWAPDSNTYAVRETGGNIKVFRNFKERSGLVNPGFKAEDVKGGALLGVIGQGFVCFYDWETGGLVRRVDVEAKDVHWSGTNELVAIVSDDSYYILRFDRGAYDRYIEAGVLDDEGAEDAFDVVTEIAESVRTAKWTGECFIYTNSNNRVQYLVGEQTHTINHTDSELYLLGYLPSHGRVYLVDKDVTVYSYALSLAVVEYQTAILRKDFTEAEEILTRVPAEQRNRIARFLETQDERRLALEVSTDPDHKFDLAVALDDFDVALEIARKGPVVGSEPRWRTIGDKALGKWNLTLAEECFTKAGDLSALLLLATTKNDAGLLQRLGEEASAKGATNIAFAAYLQLGDTGRCIDLLVRADRLPEAAMFARTYAPSRVGDVVGRWKASLVKGAKSGGSKAKQRAIAESIADPRTEAEAFEEGWEQALEGERAAAASRS